MTDTPNLALPQIAAAQAQKHVTHNEALALLDALVQLSVTSRTATAPPAIGVNGARYIIPASATGGFAGRTGQIALFDSGFWRYLVPKPGWLAYVQSESAACIFNGTIWVSLGQAIGAIDQVSSLGIGTTSDAVNKLAVRSSGALLTAPRIASGGTGDSRLAIEKETDTRTASLVFQTNSSGRGELGLAGDDDMRLKVSADGSLWRDAIQVSRSTGIVSFPQGISGGGIAGTELVQDITVAGSPTNLDIISLPTTYAGYVLAINGVAPITDDVSLLMRVQTGGNTWQTSGYEYLNFLIGPTGTVHYTSTTEANTSRIAITRSGTGFGVGSANGRCVMGQLAFSPNAANQQRMFDMSATYIRSDGMLQKTTGGMSYISTMELTGIRLFWSSGNFANVGAIRLYGLKKN